MGARSGAPGPLVSGARLRARRETRRTKRFAFAVALLSGLGIASGTAGAQDTSGGWAFTTLPLADLWFHGMALVDPIGPGPNPLYDPTYPSKAQRARLAAGVSSTPLNDRLGYFRNAFQQDAAFEVLHFLPLYFPQAGRTEVFAALELLAGTEEGIPRGPSARTSFGIAAVGSVLTTPGQRRVLGEFVHTLEEEWSEFFGLWWRGDAERRSATTAAIQASWSREFGPALRPFLQKIGMTGGLVAVVPSIGVEGRIFAGSPQAQGDNILVVSAPTASEQGREAVFSVLRELSFPVVRKAVERAGGTTGVRSEDEARASRAAVRSGALVLQAHHPEALIAYQQFFLSLAGRQAPAGADVQATFEEAYPLEAGLEAVLKEEILSTKRDGGIG